jgi:Thiamine pyrophosphate enzyme, N-terminal TPP binding domain
VTNGVGALSAINGVGGSYRDHVPVICIAGSIPLRSIDRGLGMHHTMADRTSDHFLDASAHVTAAHASLTPRNAAIEIDRLMLTAWRRSFQWTGAVRHDDIRRIHYEVASDCDSNDLSSQTDLIAPIEQKGIFPKLSNDQGPVYLTSMLVLGLPLLAPIEGSSSRLAASLTRSARK